MWCNKVAFSSLLFFGPIVVSITVVTNLSAVENAFIDLDFR